MDDIMGGIVDGLFIAVPSLVLDVEPARIKKIVNISHDLASIPSIGAGSVSAD